jgi:hypothetical protein
MVIAQRDCVELASGKCKLASPLAPKNVSASPKKTRLENQARSLSNC